MQRWHCFCQWKRATLGNLIAHKAVDKIFKIDEHLATTVAGSVGDAQKLVEYLKAEVRLYKLRTGKPATVRAAASIASNILHASRMFPFIVQMLIGGIDETGPKIYSVDPAGGKIEDKYVSTGSGSPIAYGVLEDRYKKDMSVEDAINIALRAIKSSTKRDTFSGDGISLAVVTEKEGFKRFDEKYIKSKIKEIDC